MVLLSNINTNPTCSSFIDLTQAEYVLFANNTLKGQKSGITHEASSYSSNTTTTTASVCTTLAHTPYLHYGLSTTSLQELYISVIGQFLSIIALITHLFVYSVLPRLRNIPGQNVMYLSATLLVAQDLLLIGASHTEIRGICFFFGVRIHYFFRSWILLHEYDVV